MKKKTIDRMLKVFAKARTKYANKNYDYFSIEEKSDGYLWLIGRNLIPYSDDEVIHLERINAK